MKITVHASPENKKTILDLIEEQGISLPCNCHGANACGGKQYNFPCHLIPHEEMTVTLRQRSDLEGVSFDDPVTKQYLPDTLLIDLGTTTVAMVYYHSKHHTIYHKETFPNPQISYGADVISRIRYDMEFPEEHTLRESICHEISERYECVVSSEKGIHIRTCLIGGNTTMIHFLLGFPSGGMSAAPFTPHPITMQQLHQKRNGTDIFLLPWLSAFIGGDILAGMLYLDFDHRADTCLLADLGTNGELSLLHKHHIFTASTAAGPAFEGAGLSCGCPAVPGAVSDVTLGTVLPKLQTIGNKIPTGICGSGAISMLSQIISGGYMDSDGILTKKFPDKGIFLCRTIQGDELRFTAEDTRQMQLAAAAIGAGINTLCHKAEIRPQQIDHLYLAGGLGYFINISKAAKTGLFSGIPTSRIHAVGNSCLYGLAALCENTDALPERFSQFEQMTNDIILADEPYFQKQFISHMTY